MNRNLAYNIGVSLLIADSSMAGTVEYCRQARKIRASFDRNAFLRHEALAALARKRENELEDLRALTGLVRSTGSSRVTAIPRRVVARSATATDRAEQEFADSIAAKLQPFGFTFSDRLRLLNQAERLGINRFRANVMLAMHEHQAGRVSAAEPVVKRGMPSFIAILLVELAVVGGLVWLFA